MQGEGEVATMTTGGESGLARLLRAAGVVRIPEDVRAAMAAEPGDPVSGQLWRARWDEIVEFVLLLEVGDDDVSAAPVSLDDRFADADAVILAPAQTSLATRLVVWVGLARRLPMYVLDRRLAAAHLEVANSDWVDRAVSAGAALGRASVSPLDPVHEARARVVDAVETLGAATWAPAGTGELDKLLAAASLGPQQLVDLLGVTPQTALALRRGQAAANPEQAEGLAPVLHIPAMQILEANPAPPQALVQRMSRPRRRAQVARLASRRGVDERSAWLSATYSVGALAARQTASQAEPAWDQRIDQFFQITLES
jgi:hypothetical protein